MTFWRTLLPALLICPSLTFAASKEIIELQRDLALLQEQVRTLQRAQDEKFSAIQVLVQQALDSANKTSTSVAVCRTISCRASRISRRAWWTPWSAWAPSWTR
jgi:cob(I)alamin adenosyltransferase